MSCGRHLSREILGTRTEAWQRELLSHIGTPHLGISDPQNTQRPFELTGAWKLFEEVGLKTAALIQKNARQLRNASRGRGLDGRQLTALAAIRTFFGTRRARTWTQRTRTTSQMTCAKPWTRAATD